MISDVVGNILFRRVVGADITLETEFVYDICVLDEDGTPWYERDGRPVMVSLKEDSYQYFLYAAHIKYPEMVYSHEQKMTMFFEDVIKDAIRAIIGQSN